ncbi:hypothetical protein FBU30_009267 [Linnemannia zychae]|nr:hypothetical protein FBU30_009267 [Linnemannia zychae]
MGGPGLMALLGERSSLPKVCPSKDTLLLVDVEAFHSELVEACARESEKFDSAKYFANMLLKRFAGFKGEYFVDGDGNQEKLATCMRCRDKASVLKDVEARIHDVEGRAKRKQDIKKMEYKYIHTKLRYSIVITLDFKAKVVEMLENEMAKVFFARGEADLAIRRRADDLSRRDVKFAVVGNDCDYAIHPSITTLLRPIGRDAYLQCDINARLEAAGLSRAQYQALGVVSQKDYSWNLPGLGIATNRSIIKEISTGKNLEEYIAHNKVKAAISRYRQLDQATQSAKKWDMEASCHIFVDGLETPLTKGQIEYKRQKEDATMNSIMQLKKRLQKVSILRLKALKNIRKNNGTVMPRLQNGDRFETMHDDAPPSQPSLATLTIPKCQADHWNRVRQHHSQRNGQVSIRARNYKKEHIDQHFNQFRSKQYGVKARQLYAPLPPRVQNNNNFTIPEGLEFKPFKAYNTKKPPVPKKVTKSSASALRPGPFNKRDIVKSITGLRQICVLSVGQLGRNIDKALAGHKMSVQGWSDQAKDASAENARLATVKTIRRVVRVANDLLRHGQKCMALYIQGKSDAELHPFKSAIFNRGACRTVEEAIDTTARKRKRKSTPSDLAQSEEGGRQDNDEDLSDDTKGDYNGFFKSLLSYLKNPTSTIKHNNQHIGIIKPAREEYIKDAKIAQEDFQILGHGLSSTIITTIGVMMAVQFRRYFVNNAADIPTSLPYSPTRQGFIFLSENDLWFRLQYPPAIHFYLRASTGKDTTMLDIGQEAPGWLLTRLITPIGDSMLGRSEGYSRTTTYASTQKLNGLRGAIIKHQENRSSSVILIRRQNPVDIRIANPAPNQPINVLPSYLLRGMIVTNGRDLHLSAVHLRIRAATLQHRDLPSLRPTLSSPCACTRSLAKAAKHRHRHP